MIGAILALAVTGLLLPQQDDTIRDFKRYFKRSKESWERVEFIYALETIDDPEVAGLLVPVLDDKDPKVARAAREVITRLPSEAARQPLLRELEKGRKPARVAALVRAAGDGGWREFGPLVLARLEDGDEEVRLWAATSAGQLSLTEALPELAAMAGEDKRALVRVAAVDSLGQLGRGHKAVAGPPLVAALGDPELEVATAACLALQRVRVAEAIPPLIALLEDAEGRILEHVYPTLVEITDLQFVDDPDLWQDWWEKAQEDFEIPTDEELAARRKQRARTNAVYRSSKTQATFAEIDTPSQRVVFIIDVSGSMEDLVVDREAFAKRGHTRFHKLDVVKKEISQALQGLDGKVQFNIIAFASMVHPWKTRLKQANALNKRSALDFVDRLQPIGGRAASERAAAGLGGSAALDEGRTNTYGALLAGMGLDGSEEPAEEVRTEVDTVFFLSDGKPSVGELVDPDDILKAVIELNRFRRITIHTIAIGEFQKDFMLDLARGNGGVFKDLGR